MPWLQAAAAILLFVSGMAVSQLDVDYRGDAVTVRRRAAVPGTQVEPVASRGWITLTPEGGTNDNVPLDNDGIMRDFRAQLQNASSVDTERLLQRVRSMIDQSEQRQQRELALRVSQVAREVETQHQVDVQRIEQNFGQQQDATMEYLVRTSGGAK